MIDSLIVILIAIPSAAIGLVLLSVLDASPSRAGERLLAALLVGLGLTSMLGLGLAAAGALRPWPLVVAGGLGVLLGGNRLRSTLAAMRRPTGVALLVLCGLVLVVELPALLAPPIGGDQTWYALVYPKLYGDAGALVETPWTYWGQQQLLPGFLYAVAFALRGDVLARLLNLLTVVLAAASVATLTRRLDRRSAVAAGALFLTLPMTCAIVLRTGPGLAVVAYTALATSAVLDWTRTERAGDLRRAGLLAGLAAGSGVAGLLTPAVLALLVMVVMIDRAWPVGRVLATSCTIAVLVVVLGAPWYLRNASQTGDPFHPFGERFFHARHWSAASSRYLADQHEQFRVAVIGEDERPPVLDVVWMPWDLTIHPAAPRAAFDVSPFALAFLPAALLLGRRRDRALIVGTVVVAFMAAAAILEPRAALPGVALAVAVAAPAAVALCGARITAAVVGATLVANLAIASQIDRHMWLDQVRASVGLMTPDAFLTRHSARYRFWSRANAAIPPTGRVAILEKTPHPYYVERPFVLLSYLEQGLVDYRAVDTVDALARALADQQVGFVAVDAAGLEAAGDPFEASVTRLWRAFLTTQTDLVVRRDGYALYALRPVTAVASAWPAGAPALRGAQGLSVVCDLGTTRLHPKVPF